VLTSKIPLSADTSWKVVKIEGAGLVKVAPTKKWVPTTLAGLTSHLKPILRETVLGPVPDATGPRLSE
jgi:hypothetical protein